MFVHEDPHGFKSNYVRGVGFNSNNVKSTERVDKLRLIPKTILRTQMKPELK